MGLNSLMVHPTGFSVPGLIIPNISLLSPRGVGGWVRKNLHRSDSLEDERFNPRSLLLSLLRTNTL